MRNTAKEKFKRAIMKQSVGIKGRNGCQRSRRTPEWDKRQGDRGEISGQPAGGEDPEIDIVTTESSLMKIQEGA